MLDFYLIPDNQSDAISLRQLHYAGGIEEEEFEMAQHLSVLEKQADYYGKFRWSSEQVRHKDFLLANCPFRASTALHDILSQAKAAGTGLLAVGN